MCNAYAPPEPPEIVAYFNSLPPVGDYALGLGPWGRGPYVRPIEGRRHTIVGLWALARDGQPRLPRPGDPQTNNCRSETMATKVTFKGAWARGQRCIVPAKTFDEPRYFDDKPKATWWRFARRDGAPWGVAGLWNDWVDPQTGEVTGTYTMVTTNADAHPIMSLMHKPERDADGNLLAEQDKRSIVLLEREDWDTWLFGSNDEAMALVRLPDAELFDHGPAPARVRKVKEAAPPDQGSLL